MQARRTTAAGVLLVAFLLLGGTRGRAEPASLVTSSSVPVVASAGASANAPAVPLGASPEASLSGEGAADASPGSALHDAGQFALGVRNQLLAMGGALLELAKVSGEGMAVETEVLTNPYGDGTTTLQRDSDSQAFVRSVGDGVATTVTHPIGTATQAYENAKNTVLTGSWEQRGELFTSSFFTVAPAVGPVARLAWLGRVATTAEVLGASGDLARGGDVLAAARTPGRVVDMELGSDGVYRATAPRAIEGPAAEPTECVGARCATLGRCFAAGTLVDTEEGPRAIETLRAGDRVVSRDDATGAVALRPVLRTIVTEHRALEELVLSSSQGSETIRVTPNHPFFVEGRGWTPASEVAPGRDPLSTEDGEPLVVSSARSLGQDGTVYNLEVGAFHTYFVGRAHAWVHNQSADACPALQAQRALWGVTTEDLENATALIDKVKNPNKGQFESYIGTLQLADGRTARVVLKPASGEASQGPFQKGTLYLREVAASRMSDFLGWDLVPPTVALNIGGQVSSAQLFVVADSGNVLPRGVWPETLSNRRSIAFDYLIRNLNRYNVSGNYFYRIVEQDGEKKGFPVLIDHGLTFPSKDITEMAEIKKLGALPSNYAAPKLFDDRVAREIWSIDAPGLASTLREADLDEPAIAGVLTRLELLRQANPRPSP